jgi:hypothetical protein
VRGGSLGRCCGEWQIEEDEWIRRGGVKKGKGKKGKGE